jgi:hypothetical protein
MKAGKVGARKKNEKTHCMRCGRKWEIGMWPTCRGNQEDHGERLRLGKFVEFEYEGRTISSLHQLRKIEKESIKQGKPIAFRAFALNNDGKHYDGPVFGPNPDAQKPTRFRDRTGRPFVGTMAAPPQSEWDRDD